MLLPRSEMIFEFAMMALWFKVRRGTLLSDLALLVEVDFDACFLKHLLCKPSGLHPF